MMSSAAAVVDSGNASDKNNAGQKPQWPLGFRLQPPQSTESSLRAFGVGSNRPPPRRWWSHRLYRGPGNKEVEILYSRTRAQSELIAQRFLGEPVLGFDMEWPWKQQKRNDLQSKIGLIQIACEDKIALFHIGLHPGKTTDEIIAPTLRKIIEDPGIAKVGVAIVKADFDRLRRFFGLSPKGAIECSFLHRLVTFDARKPELVSISFVSLAQQVEFHLGLPLEKGAVRTSNWSAPLSQEQINYAAGDAYAGFMLYHCMNAKRLAMHPTPPPPVCADLYPKPGQSKHAPLLLDAGNGKMITSEEFFGVVHKAKARGKAQVPGLSAAKEQDKPDSSLAFEKSTCRMPQMHTGLSFTLAETLLDIDDAGSEDSLPSLDFGMAPRQKKRKRSGSASGGEQSHGIQHDGLSAATELSHGSHQPLTPRSKISRNKILAFSKLVTRGLPGRSPTAPPLITDHAIDLIVRRAPRTQDDLEKIPGIDAFLLACQQTDRDLLKNIVKFAPAGT